MRTHDILTCANLRAHMHACVTALVWALRHLDGRYIQQSRVLWILAIIILPIDLAPEMGWFTVVATFIYTLR